MKIVDQTLFPYEIALDGNNYTVEEITKKVNSKGETIYKNHGYYSSLEGALGKIISLKMIDSGKSVTLNEFIQEYKEIKNEIKEAIKF